MLDLVVRAFRHLDDADVDAFVVAAVGDVLATFIAPRSPTEETRQRGGPVLRSKM